MSKIRKSAHGTIEKAIEIAAQAHSGQVDRGGKPYILHSLRVMAAVNSVDEKIAAVLHDVVEDTDVTLEILRQEGFSDTVLAAIDALTKKRGESKMDAAIRASKNPIALAVKLADNNDNMDMRRLGTLSSKDCDRFNEYLAIRKYLISQLSEKKRGMYEQN